MDITCFRCKNTWEVPPGKMLVARLKHALGQDMAHFTCPNCGARNELTSEEFHSYDRPQNVVPVTATLTRPGTEIDGTTGTAPTNPIEAPRTGSRQVVVRARGVEARRDHSHWAEVMGSFHQGETLTIVDTWTDGENTWVQFGPERWIDIEQDGEPVFDLID